LMVVARERRAGPPREELLEMIRRAIA